MWWLLAGCGGTGDWIVETWGEDYIEVEIPSAVFSDGCTVSYAGFSVAMGVDLVDGDGAVVGSVPARVYDLTEGAAPMGRVAVPADHYSEVRLQIAPLDELGGSVLVDGTLGCGADEVRFRWLFDEATTYLCEPTDLTIPAGGSDESQITIHGDHLWYDGLENPDAEVRGEAVVAADDGDGELTLDELDAVSIPSLGYEVGEYSDVLTLKSFVSHLTRTIGHIDGEGECRVDF